MVRRRTQVTMILVVALALGVWQASSLRDQVRENELLTQRLRGIRSVDADAQQRLAVLREDVAQSRQLLDAARSRLIRGESPRSGGIHDQPDWTKPSPPESPWDPESPYAWVPKSLLPRFVAAPFDSRGRLRSRAAEILALSTAEKAAVEAAAGDWAGALEAHEAERVEELEPETQGGESARRLRITPDPAFLERQRTGFRDRLVQAVGEQRASLLVPSDEGLEFSISTVGVPRTYTLQRVADGEWSVHLESPMGGLSTTVGTEQFQLLPESVRKRLEAKTR